MPRWPLPRRGSAVDRGPLVPTARRRRSAGIGRFVDGRYDAFESFVAEEVQQVEWGRFMRPEGDDDRDLRRAD